MKKLINDPRKVAAEALEGLALAYPQYVKLVAGAQAVVRNDAPIAGKVGVLSGGGSVSEIRAQQFRLLLTSMESSVAATGKVKPGDRTILDAIHAAAAAGSSATELDVAVDLSATAAEESALSTANMLCRVGRASRLGNRVLGHPDPAPLRSA